MLIKAHPKNKSYVITCPSCKKNFAPYMPRGYGKGSYNPNQTNALLSGHKHLPGNVLGKLLRQWRFEMNYSLAAASMQLDIHHQVLKTIEHRKDIVFGCTHLVKLIKNGVRHTVNTGRKTEKTITVKRLLLQGEIIPYEHKLGDMRTLRLQFQNQKAAWQIRYWGARKYAYDQDRYLGSRHKKKNEYVTKQF